MKLVAGWVKNYINLQDLGFNLGDEVYFKFQFDSNINQLIVDYETTFDYIDLNKGNKLINISGILGSNGVGKTNILKLFRLIKSKKGTHETVLIFKINDKYVVRNYSYKTYYEPQHFTVSLSKKNIDENQKPIEIEIKNSATPLEDIDVIFYSNEFSDFNDLLINKNDSLNVSVNYQVRSKLNFTETKNYVYSFDSQLDIFGESRKSFEQFDPLSLYFNHRLKNQFDFLIDAHKDQLWVKDILKIISLPSFVDIRFDEGFFDAIKIYISDSKYNSKHFLQVIDYAVECIDKIKENPYTRLENELTLKFFLWAFVNNMFEVQAELSEEKFKQFIKSLPLDSSLFQALRDLILNAQCRVSDSELEKLKSILTKYYNKTYGIELDQYMVNGFRFFINYKIKVEDNLWQFMSEVNDLLSYSMNPFIKFKWHNLSAGQEAFLTFFSEIWHALKKCKKKNILILIDEGELYLHPEWQRVYIDLLYSFLNSYAEKNGSINTIQLIVTSHSPFIASDLPKHNLVLLDTEESELAEIEKPENKETYLKTVVKSNQVAPQTFAGNIFDVYKRSFFLKDYIGEYSKKVIFSILEEETERSEKMPFVKKRQILELIADPILRDLIDHAIKQQNDNSSDKI